MEHNTVLVGMSGGVDSTTAAFLLKRQGYGVRGVTLRMHDEAENTAEAEAAEAAAVLGIPHDVFDLRGDFRNTVMRYFAEAYLAGQTPNPCVYCNRNMKFPGMLAFADRTGCDAVATGHYARVKKQGERTLLLRAADVKKDQTYMLYALPQEILARVLFPLGGLTKPQIREIAAEAGLAAAHKHDSQDICFIADGDYNGFIRRLTGKQTPVGRFIDAEGRVLGTHKGVTAYTVGQRKGLGLSSEEPYYVLGKSAADNTVTLGRAADLFTRRVCVGGASFIPFDRLTSPIRATAKLRYSQHDSPCTVFPDENGFVLEFDEPQRAVTPGQAAVLYDGETVLGGGTIL